MGSRNVYRVLPDAGRWKVTINGSLLRHFTLKQPAIDYAVDQAKRNQPSQVVVHRADGTIEFEWTYGQDPYPPPG